MKYGALIVAPILIYLGAGNCRARPSKEYLTEILADQTSTKVESVVLISVYDNYRTEPRLKTGWGFATVVKTPNEIILFDTGGDSETLLFNMKEMEIAPGSIDTIFVSHIHADHAGGLEGFLEKNNHATVFIPSSFPDSVRTMITDKGARFVDVSGPRQICGFAFSTGELYGPPQEQSLIINTTNGLVVITGCAHSGIVSIVENVTQMFPEEKVYLALGGFHSPPIAAVKALRQLGVQNVAPSHCTGDRAIAAFQEQYGAHFIEYGVGRTIEVDEMECE